MRDPKALLSWETMAPHYDRSIGFLERRLVPDGREWVCSRAHGRVLEIAVGTGLNLPHYSTDVHVTGIDFSPAMLKLARGRAATAAADVVLCEADAQRLPFTDASFDTAVSTLSLCGVPDNAAAVAEIHRVLKPGGTLLLLDHVGSTWPPIWLFQRLLEVITVRSAGEHYTRRQLPVVQRAGFRIAEARRDKAGVIERLAAVKTTA